MMWAALIFFLIILAGVCFKKQQQTTECKNAESINNTQQLGIIATSHGTCNLQTTTTKQKKKRMKTLQTSNGNEMS